MSARSTSSLPQSRWHRNQWFAERSTAHACRPAQYPSRRQDQHTESPRRIQGISNSTATSSQRFQRDLKSFPESKVAVPFAFTLKPLWKGTGRRPKSLTQAHGPDWNTIGSRVTYVSISQPWSSYSAQRNVGIGMHRASASYQRSVSPQKTGRQYKTPSPGARSRTQSLDGPECCKS